MVSPYSIFLDTPAFGYFSFTDIRITLAATNKYALSLRYDAFATLDQNETKVVNSEYKPTYKGYFTTLRQNDIAAKLLASLPVIAQIVGIARIVFALRSPDLCLQDYKWHLLRGTLEIFNLGVILAVVDLILPSNAIEQRFPRY